MPNDCNGGGQEERKGQEYHYFKQEAAPQHLNINTDKIF